MRTRSASGMSISGWSQRSRHAEPAHRVGKTVTDQHRSNFVDPSQIARGAEGFPKHPRHPRALLRVAALLWVAALVRVSGMVVVHVALCLPVRNMMFLYVMRTTDG